MKEEMADCSCWKWAMPTRFLEWAECPWNLAKLCLPSFLQKKLSKNRIKKTANLCVIKDKILKQSHDVFHAMIFFHETERRNLRSVPNFRLKSLRLARSGRQLHDWTVGQAKRRLGRLWGAG
jgi:hypothetical protein